MDAMLSGWDHARTLTALRLAPRFAESHAMDRFDFKVREQIPNRGLDALKALLLGEDGKPYSPAAEPLLRSLDELATLEAWRPLSLTPQAWAARFQTLRHFFR